MTESASSAHPRIPIDRERIAAFCRKWRITEFALFGSVLRDDFRPDSDVDVLVTFAGGTSREAGDYLAMYDELRTMFNREVDLVELRRVKNPYRRSHILRNRMTIYAA